MALTPGGIRMWLRDEQIANVPLSIDPLRFGGRWMTDKLEQLLKAQQPIVMHSVQSEKSKFSNTQHPQKA